MKTSGYGRPSTSSAVTASHRIARGTVSGAHGSGAGGTWTTPGQRYRAMEIITPQQLRMGKRRTGAVAFVGDTRAILALLGRVLVTVPVYHPEPGSSRSLGASSLRRPPRSPRSPPPSRRRSSPPSLLRSPAGGRRGGGGSDW